MNLPLWCVVFFVPGENFGSGLGILGKNIVVCSDRSIENDKDLDGNGQVFCLPERVERCQKIRFVVTWHHDDKSEVCGDFDREKWREGPLFLKVAFTSRKGRQLHSPIFDKIRKDTHETQSGSGLRQQ
jgi:hypothetical protein